MFGFFKTKPSPKVGEIYELMVENPFKRGEMLVEILGIKEKWVLYQFEEKSIEKINTGVIKSRPISKFLKLYRRKQENDRKSKNN